MPTRTEQSSAKPRVEDRSSRRWIRRRLGQLDPRKDFAEIFRLNTVFQVNGFMSDWVGAQTMPRFATTPSAPAIYRGGKGKLMLTSDRRLHDTGNHALVWAEYGLDAPQSKHSVDMVNALHTKYAQEYPDAFDDPEPWIYVLGYEICGVYMILNDYLGYPLPDEKSRTAAVLFGKKLAEMVVMDDGRFLTEIISGMDDWDDWVAVVREYESRIWPYSHEAAMCAAAAIGNFQKRFPGPLRPFGRALVTSFWYEGMYPGAGVERPGRLMRWAATAFMKSLMAVAPLLPDSKESWAEKQQRLYAEKGRPMAHVLKVTQGAAGAGTGGCPVGFGRGTATGSDASGPKEG
ncbi:hypothetical protein [Streptomyces justiciae]|uniref:hypothetical protein n=1 Tax=Streptomyces justiciae TaxID=2780140 RepID=UPI002117AC6C|nr:hypothetical protein [Streptomyces justiciae]MCW8379727.1 hypothetical protein [Streptomyces justiciae]